MSNWKSIVYAIINIGENEPFPVFAKQTNRKQRKRHWKVKKIEGSAHTILWMPCSYQCSHFALAEHRSHTVFQGDSLYKYPAASFWIPHTSLVSLRQSLSRKPHHYQDNRSPVRHGSEGLSRCPDRSVASTARSSRTSEGRRPIPESRYSLLADQYAPVPRRSHLSPWNTSFFQIEFRQNGFSSGGNRVLHELKHALKALFLTIKFSQPYV